MLLRCACVLVLSVVALLGQSGPWTVTDVVRQETVMGAELSRDGAAVLWQLRRCDDKEKALHTKAYLSHVSSEEAPRQLLFGDDDDVGPVFSPDRRLVAFLSARKPTEGQGPEEAEGDEEATDGKHPQQVWLLRLDGGEPYCVSALPLGAEAVCWSGPRELLITARERRDWAAEQRHRNKDEAQVVEDLQDWRAAATHLFRLHLEDDFTAGAMTRLTRDADQLQSVSVAPDGRSAVLVRIESPQHEIDERDPPRISLLQVSTGVQTPLFTERRNRPLAFAWAADSSGFYAEMPRSSVDGATTAAVLDVVWHGANGIEPCALQWDRGVMPGSVMATSDGFMALLMNGAVPRPVRARRTDSGWEVNALRLEAASDSAAPQGHVHQWVRAVQAERVLLVIGTASRPDRWCVATLAGAALQDVREVYAPNEGFKDKPLATARVLQWTGAQGDPVEGILFSPSQAQGALPLVVMPHGGPFAHDLDRFDEGYAYAPNLYAQRGARVLYVNYHGSSGYGLAFGESIRGRYYELELIDIVKGIQQLVSDGLVDPAQLAVAGWSNGAILATALVSMAEEFVPGTTLRFKACIHGAGDVNWSSDYGNCAFGPVFDDFYLGGPPWKIPGVYQRKSPLFYAEQVTTPTLIFFGTEDTAVPTEQGHQWYRALQQIGKAPVRMLLFPGEEHGLLQPKFWRRKLEEEFVWMDRYFFKRPAAAPLLEQDAPLADLLAAVAYARQGTALGVARAGLLLPEVLPLGTVAVGRFEVTRAQWRSVFADTPVVAGSENAPVTGVSAADAQRFVAEIAARTGEPWRLLTRDEWELLPTGPEENTFSAWLGYEPPPQALADLRALAADAPTQLGLPPLLLQVGLRRPGSMRRGEELLRFHDVGGNVAEWVSDDDGSVAACGLSAFSVEDVDGEPEKPLPAYIGLRVALGPKPVR